MKKNNIKFDFDYWYTELTKLDPTQNTETIRRELFKGKFTDLVEKVTALRGGLL